MSSSIRKPWTREELILAINLYCKTSFGKIHVHNPEIIHLANLLGRTAGSISYKLANFASIDPSLNRKGASNVSKLDKEVWEEFFSDWNEMVFESEKVSCKIQGRKIEESVIDSIPEGKTKDTLVKTRVNQKFFRKMILSSYNSRCCITGVSVEQLLIASHIIPWSMDSKKRLNPQNGLCLNALHDKAFDSGLITIDESFRVVVSPKIKSIDSDGVGLITDYEGKMLAMPSRFVPSQEFLQYHRDNIFTT